MSRAERTRDALIVDESDAKFVLDHIQELKDLYPCSGILIRLHTGGIAYHATPVENVPGIETFGLKATQYAEATYGPGVIYTYPDLSCYRQRLDPSVWALFQLEYGAGCLKALTTFIKGMEEQHEILIFPDKLLKCERIQISESIRLPDGVQDTTQEIANSRRGRIIPWLISTPRAL